MLKRRVVAKLNDLEGKRSSFIPLIIFLKIDGIISN